MPKASCATCKIVYAVSEKNLTLFGNGDSAHNGNCTLRYKDTRPGVHIISNDAVSLEGALIVPRKQPLSNQVGILSPA